MANLKLEFSFPAFAKLFLFLYSSEISQRDPSATNWLLKNFVFFFFFSFFLPGSVMLAMYQYTLVVQFLLSQWTCCWAGWIHTIIWSELAWILTGVNCLSTTDVKKQEMGLFSSVKRNFSYSEHFSTTTKKYNLLNIRELNCKMEEIWLRSQQ